MLQGCRMGRGDSGKAIPNLLYYRWDQASLHGINSSCEGCLKPNLHTHALDRLATRIPDGVSTPNPTPVQGSRPFHFVDDRYRHLSARQMMPLQMNVEGATNKSQIYREHSGFRQEHDGRVTRLHLWTH
ncbi:uncharacterized protein LOC120901279 [Anopheles arabiensis]|uniref:uncharacterized protein LOC120901279 n=1 Tax=Anopheles arabiensis TaxID=7173 RepID=UPI001AADDD14|nr:uncharacterized protein LOC120901279 [Anopheles arabiensis]XP_040164941.1 uncharacterized protein LOC120901279 [Anopheles arabiensis]